MSMDKKQITKLLSFMATFDGGIYKPKGDNANCMFIMNMRKENLDYVEWVQSVLSEVTGSRLTDRPDYNTDGFTRQPQVRLESRRHPFLSKLHGRIYVQGKKIIDPHMLKLLDAEALAIIFMCDGGSGVDSRFKNLHAYIELHTKAFSYFDNMALSKAIYEKLGIRTTINRQNQYFYLRVKSADIELFVKTVQPYVLPSFVYKLERVAPALPGGDIVCSASKGVDHGGNDHDL